MYCSCTIIPDTDTKSSVTYFHRNKVCWNKKAVGIFHSHIWGSELTGSTAKNEENCTAYCSISTSLSLQWAGCSKIFTSPPQSNRKCKFRSYRENNCSYRGTDIRRRHISLSRSWTVLAHLQVSRHLPNWHINWANSRLKKCCFYIFIFFL